MEFNETKELENDQEFEPEFRDKIRRKVDVTPHLCIYYLQLHYPFTVTQSLQLFDLLDHNANTVMSLQRARALQAPTMRLMRAERTSANNCKRST
jgi:hypothetical protein